jgi:hypothetical protein
MFAHFAATVNVPAKGKVPPAEARLRKGVAVTGKVMSPDGSPAESAMLLCVGRVSPVRGYSCQPLPVGAGEYKVPGCVPDEPARAYLLSPTERLGAVVDVRGGKPGPDVRLAPCGTARVRVLLEGNPAVGCEVSLLLLAERNGVEHRQPADWFDPVNYGERLFTDEKGRADLSALIPGARYVVRATLPGQRAVSAPFTAVSAKSVPLPDLHLPPAKRTTK